jgi:hypothetical protein
MIFNPTFSCFNIQQSLNMTLLKILFLKWFECCSNSDTIGTKQCPSNLLQFHTNYHGKIQNDGITVEWQQITAVQRLEL